jgi:PPOX class probable F420-dependent enzyme
MIRFTRASLLVDSATIADLPPRELFGKNKAVDFSEQQRTFLEQSHSAAMTTLRSDGTPVVVRIGVALVDGKLWSSGTQDRIRTRHLRRDPRSTVIVFEAGFRYLSIESRVTILEGPDAPEQHVRLFRIMQKRPSGPLSWYGSDKSEEEFLRSMIDEKRLIYEFEPLRIYGGV